MTSPYFTHCIVDTVNVKNMLLLILFVWSLHVLSCDRLTTCLQYVPSWRGIADGWTDIELLKLLHDISCKLMRHRHSLSIPTRGFSLVTDWFTSHHIFHQLPVFFMSSSHTSCPIITSAVAWPSRHFCTSLLHFSMLHLPPASFHTFLPFCWFYLEEVCLGSITWASSPGPWQACWGGRPTWWGLWLWKAAGKVTNSVFCHDDIPENSTHLRDLARDELIVKYK